MIYKVRRYYSEVYPELGSGTSYMNAQVTPSRIRRRAKKTNNLANSISRDLLLDDSLPKPRGMKRWLRAINVSSELAKKEDKTFADSPAIKPAVSVDRSELTDFTRKMDVISNSLPGGGSTSIDKE